MSRLGTRIAAVVAAGALLLTGCSQGTPPTSQGSQASKVKLGMSISTLNNPFFVSLEKGAVVAHVERVYAKRVIAIWEDCRSRYASMGPWLFGRFSIADAML